MLFSLLQDTTETPQDQKGEIDVNTQSIVEKIDTWLDGFIRNVPNIVMGIVLFIAMLYVGRWAGRLVKKQMSKRGRDNFGEILGGFLKYTIVILGLLLALTVISPNLKPADLIAGLGVSSVAIGFAFKDILQNWLAGILILLRQPFKIGDQIVVNDYEGTVDRIETRATIITTYDGQDVVIPNGDIYTNAVQVKTAHDSIRSQYDLGLGYDQDRDKAMKILRKTIEGIDGINKEKPIDILPWDQSDSWLTIRMRWWTKSERADVVKVFSKVILETQNAMDKANIDLPFPTHVEISKKLEELDDASNETEKEQKPA